LIALAPFVVLHSALLGIYGRDANDPTLAAVPFQGLFDRFPWGQAELEEIYTVVLPGLVALAMVVVIVRRVTPATLALGLNVLGLIVLLPKESYESYTASGRISLGVVVAFVAGIPALSPARRAVAVALPAVLWLAPWDFWSSFAFLS
jgi:hypothetical protein